MAPKKRKLSSFANKIICDPIHGNIELSPLCAKIVDTPEFQRLRNIKHLGACSFVYPGATHTRFEHSIGTYHLAGLLVRALKDKQPELKITPNDVLCVEIAGLCHDLGHGPFSHLFDKEFLDTIDGEGWKHEQGSLDMFEEMIKANHLILKQGDIVLKDRDNKFIKEMIYPKKFKTENQDFKGRPKDKWFLYEIISNEENSIDVDKWDYFLRDCYMTGVKCSFGYQRCINIARVIKVDGCNHICYRDKGYQELFEMFHTRDRLFRTVYRHKVSDIVEIMITDALNSANGELKYKGKDGEELNLSETVQDMTAYKQVTDYALFEIFRLPETEQTRKAKEIVRNIHRRNLYRFIGDKRFPLKEKDEEGEHKNTIVVKDEVRRELIKRKEQDGVQRELIERKEQDEVRNELIERMEQEGETLTDGNKENIVVKIVAFTYTNDEGNPLDKVWFYSKDANQAYRYPIDKKPLTLPEKFGEKYVRVVSKDRDEEFIKRLRTAFEGWYQGI